MEQGAPENKKLYRRPVFAAAVFVIAALLPLFYKVLTMPSDPRVVFLASPDGARWIHAVQPYMIKAKAGTEAVLYRKRFRLEHAAPGAVLTVQALRSAAVTIDGRLVLPFTTDLNAWKTPRSVAVGQQMTAGDHEITVRVFNENGPALLAASCKEVGLFSGEDWETSADGSQWRPAALASRTNPLEPAERFPTTYHALLSLAPVYLPLFFGIFLFALWSPRLGNHKGWAWMRPSPSAVRWVLIGLWALLAINNIMKLDLDKGYDAPAHYEYIDYVSRTWHVPLATQGWQMFQSPLYYFISAVLNVLLSLAFPKATVGYLLRVVPLACGLLQVELSYRAARYVFPDRRDLQIIGTVLGGLLPMNMYISHYVGNEPLAGLLSGSVLVMILSLLQKQEPPTRKQWVYLGTVLGLALLTKVTAVLLLLPLMLFIYYFGLVKDGLRARPLPSLLLVFSVALIISGWYYCRNWLALGTPFVGGWESSRWWQDPGYRTAHDFLSFGASLFRPVYSGIHGFWDSLYSTFWSDGFLGSTDLYDETLPPWNYRFLLSGTLLSLVPAAAIAAGMIRAFARPSRSIANGTLLSAVSVLLYTAVLLYLYVSLPIYSTAKATYTLGILPGFVVLGLSGLELVMKNIYAQALVYAALACWAVSSYASFFIVS